MPQSLAQIYLHLVYSTKKREAFLVDPSIREQLHAYLAKICQTVGSPALKVGGVEDHVHILCRFGRTGTVADLVRDLKRDSSVWLKRTFPTLSVFDWQDGYGAFSIGPGHVDVLTEYIAKQEEHHLKLTFQDEFRELLRKYRVEYDERYLWD